MAFYRTGGAGSDDFQVDGVLRYVHWRNVTGDPTGGSGSTDITSSPRYYGMGIITPVSFGVSWGGNGVNTFVFKSSVTSIRVRIMVLSCDSTTDAHSIEFSGCTAKTNYSDPATLGTFYTDATLSDISGEVTITAGCRICAGIVMVAEAM